MILFASILTLFASLYFNIPQVWLFWTWVILTLITQLIVDKYINNNINKLLILNTSIYIIVLLFINILWLSSIWTLQWSNYTLYLIVLWGWSIEILKKISQWIYSSIKYKINKDDIYFMVSYPTLILISLIIISII